jgi:hypothetical protein
VYSSVVGFTEVVVVKTRDVVNSVFDQLLSCEGLTVHGFDIVLRQTRKERG